jgi:hypothetical protein
VAARLQEAVVVRQLERVVARGAAVPSDIDVSGARVRDTQLGEVLDDHRRARAGIGQHLVRLHVDRGVPPPPAGRLLPDPYEQVRLADPPTDAVDRQPTPGDDTLAEVHRLHRGGDELLTGRSYDLPHIAEVDELGHDVILELFPPTTEHREELRHRGRLHRTQHVQLGPHRAALGRVRAERRHLTDVLTDPVRPVTLLGIRQAAVGHLITCLVSAMECADRL